MKLIAELRSRYPALAERSKRGPLAAIRLFCLECMGGERTAPKACGVTDCALYPFREGHGFRRAPEREQSPDNQ